MLSSIPALLKQISATHVTPQRLVRPLLYMTLFAALTITAIYSTWGQDANAAAQSTTPAGSTIPPGGTIPPPAEPGEFDGQLNILHVAPVSSALIDTGVQICDEDGNNVTDYLYYQQQTGYFNLGTNKYDWIVAEAGSNCANVLLDLPPFRIAPGSRLLLIIFGDGANQPLDSMLIVERTGVLKHYLPHTFGE